MKLALAGLVLGLLAAFAATRVLSSLLFGVSAHDPLTFAGVALVLARRGDFGVLHSGAARDESGPMVALRYE